MILQKLFSKQRGNRGAFLRAALKLTVVFLAGFGVYVLLSPRMLVVRNIDCVVVRAESEEAECDEVVMAELRRYEGKPLFHIPTAAIEEKLLAAQRTMESVEVSVRIPNRLAAALRRRVPVGQIIADPEADDAMLVDQTGVVLASAQWKQDLPAIVWPKISQWPIERQIPSEILRAIELVRLSSGKIILSHPPIIEDDRSLQLTLAGGSAVRFSLTKDPLAQLRSLQLVLDQAKIDGQPRFIDLRFANPVVK